jgi:hypothetical protein
MLADPMRSVKTLISFEPPISSPGRAVSEPSDMLMEGLLWLDGLASGMAKCAGHESARREGHVGQRQGLFILLAGPDGSGKSTLAPKLLHQFRDAVPFTRHMHWRPGLLPQASTLVGAGGGDPSKPHAQVPHGRVVSLCLLCYYWLDFLLGTWLRVVPVRARGGLVILERGWWDYAVDSRRYRLRVSPKLVRFLGRLLPQPDLVMILEASPELLHGRKPELPMEELSRQMERWRELELPKRSRRTCLDVSQNFDQVLKTASERIWTELEPDVIEPPH